MEGNILNVMGSFRLIGGANHQPVQAGMPKSNPPESTPIKPNQGESR
jgi:hypothetical protein